MRPKVMHNLIVQGILQKLNVFGFGVGQIIVKCVRRKSIVNRLLKRFALLAIPDFLSAKKFHSSKPASLKNQHHNKTCANHWQTETS
jgi:hypothetical protein